MLGIEDTEVPASQVGNRRYARGRAYDPDRFKLPEEPAAKAEEASTEAENVVAEAAENNENEEVKEET